MSNQTPLKIIFAGSGEFGLPTLKAVQLAGHEIVQVYSQPDKPAGRGRTLTPTPIAQYAIEQKLPLLCTDSLNSQILPVADVMIVIAFGQKISDAIANHAKYGSVNLHASLLPAYRGAAPIHWAILRGETVTGNSIIRLAQKMDAGAVLEQSRLVIGETETTGELHDRLSEDGAPLMLSVLQKLADGTSLESVQNESLATSAPKLSRDSAMVDFTQPPDKVSRQIRGLYPWPGCKVKLIQFGSDGLEKEIARLTLVRGSVDQTPHSSQAQPGEILANGNIACDATGSVQILEVQPEGKRPMKLSDFKNGKPWCAGMRLLAI